MRGIILFLKSTLVGGLVVLVPLIAILGVVVWAGDIAFKAILPVFEWLPDQSVGGVSLTVMMALLALLAACFVMGLLAETAILRGLGKHAERLALSIPGYALMKSVGANLIGVEGDRLVKAVAVRFEASCVLGFLMETMPDGRHVVFVPGVPRAMVGVLHIVDKERIQLLDMSVSRALDVLGRLGVGLGESWPSAASRS